MEAASAGGLLTVDLDALAANWRTLQRLAAPAECGAAVKANGYGLGAAPVGRALALAGCRSFFVAHPIEGIGLRQAIGAAPSIYVLHGPPAGEEAALLRHDLVPVLSAPEQVAAWQALARAQGRALPAALHVDTGMNRLGLTTAEAARLLERPDALAGLDLKLLLSHLACSELADHPLNREQRARFAAIRARLPRVRASFANSGGVLLGGDYHFDLVRPGLALYGVDPRPEGSELFRQVVHLQGRILQVRRVDPGMSVGYGATHRAARPGRIATVSVGYADGFLRSLSNRGYGFIGEYRVPLVGRVSMDLTTFDVTDVPEPLAHPGALVDLIGGPVPLTSVAAAAGTNEYEILTRLGPRLHRLYRGAGA